MKITKLLLIIFLLVVNPIKTNSAEILQINSSDSILVGDQNRFLSIKLFCLEIDENNEQLAINLLKKEFPRGSKVKIKPFTFKDDVLIAEVFKLNEKKEMADVLITNNLAKETCKD